MTSPGAGPPGSAPAALPLAASPGEAGPEPMPDRVFYDGGCALCHATVRFLLARDRGGGLFRFAPLGGETFRALVPPASRDGLPDSVVVLADDGRLLTRGAAARHLLGRLGGAWGALSRLLGILPPRLLDAGYDAVARLRRGLAPPRESCPALPAPLRSRLDP